MSSAADIVIHGESRLFAGNKLGRDSQKEQLELSINQTMEEINGMEARPRCQGGRNQTGWCASATNWTLCSRRRSSSIRGSIRRTVTGRGYWESAARSQASIARAKVRASEIRVQIIAVDQNASTEAQRDLRTVDARISELSERKLAIEDRLSRTEIRSPVSGYVNELFVHTVGGVITPAAKIATIVPQNAELKFEIKISPADIDQVREGQSARVRLTAFNRTTTPEMKARVAMVSPASARDPANGQEFYIAYVNLLPTEDAIAQTEWNEAGARHAGGGVRFDPGKNGGFLSDKAICRSDEIAPSANAERNFGRRPVEQVCRALTEEQSRRAS